MKKKISLIFGTRPEAIKLAPLIKALEKQSEISFSVCSTGQHKEMLDQVLDVFEITPDVNLSVMTENQSLSKLTSQLLSKIDSYLGEAQPDMVLAQGDTTTVFATALTCFYRKIPFGHVEAGLRTYNMQAPWPEEANRVLTSKISTLHFAPTETSYKNLIQENVSEEAVFVTGNTVVDALKLVISRIDRYTDIIKEDVPSKLFDSKDKIVLVTGHRRENFDGGLESVCTAVKTLAGEFPDVQFVYPVHLNPAVQEVVQKTLGDSCGNVHIIGALSYIPFVWLMNRADFIITDSGGIQEEAPSLGKPVLVTRDVTERPEGVEAGSTVLVGTDAAKIVDYSTRLLTNSEFYASMAQATSPYGDGTAAEKIITFCKEYICQKAK